MDRFQDGPRGAQEAPRPPQEAPRGPQERPRRPQEGPKRASRDPKSRSRGLKTHSRAPKSIPRRPKGFSEAPGSAAVFGKFIKFKSRLQKASKTLKIADIDESQRPCLKSQNEKRRAGGGDPPWGSQSAATRRVGACLNRFSKFSFEFFESKSLARPRAVRTRARTQFPGPPTSLQNRLKNRSKF